MAQLLKTCHYVWWLESISNTHMMEEKNNFPQAVIWPQHRGVFAHALSLSQKY